MFSRVLRFTRKVAFNSHVRNIVTVSNNSKPLSITNGSSIFVTDVNAKKLVKLRPNTEPIKEISDPTPSQKYEKVEPDKTEIPKENDESKKDDNEPKPQPSWKIGRRQIYAAVALGGTLLIGYGLRNRYCLIPYEKQGYDSGFYTEKGTTLNGVKHGKCTRYYDNKDVLSVFYFENGKRHGKCITYYKRSGEFENPVMKSIEIYDRGILSGLTTKFHANGKIAEECTYVDRILNFKREYYESGYLKSSSEYRMGRINGIHSIYADTYSNSLLSAINYHDSSGELIARFNKKGKNTMVYPNVWQTIYKACVVKDGNDNIAAIVRMVVPPYEARVNPLGEADKVRVKAAYVNGIFDRKGHPFKNDVVAESFVHQGEPLKYIVGRDTVAPSIELDPREQCGAGVNAHVNMEDCYQWFSHPGNMIIFKDD